MITFWYSANIRLGFLRQLKASNRINPLKSKNLSRRTTMRTKTEVEVVSGFNLQSFEPVIQEQVKSFDLKLREAMKSFADATLRMGEALHGIQSILEPRDAFTAYLKSLPGLSRATAYRYIGYYTGLKEKLPELLVERIVTAGLPMQPTKDKPFGRYSKVMKKTPLPKGILTAERADAWINDLQTKYRGTRRVTTKSPEQLKEETIGFILRRFNRIPEKDRLVWLRDVLTDVGNNVGLAIAVSLKPEAAVTKAAEALEGVLAVGRPSVAKGAPTTHA
jgi:hypothetical protein